MEEKSKCELGQRGKVGSVRHGRGSRVQNDAKCGHFSSDSYRLKKVLTTIRYALTREATFRTDAQTGHTGVTWRLLYSDFVPT